MKIENCFNVKLIEEYTIKPEIKGLSKAERLSLLEHLFKSEYQGKVVSFQMLEEKLFVETTTTTRTHFSIFRRGSSFKGYMAKLNIGASGDYLPLISNCEYVSSADEQKPKQNKFHKNTLRWHYFAKEILCDGERFRVQIDVRENKRHRFIVYSVGMKPVRYVREKDYTVQKNRREPVNSGPIGSDVGGVCTPTELSSDGIIPQDNGFVKRENKKSLMSLIAEAMGRRSVPGAERKQEERER